MYFVVRAVRGRDAYDVVRLRQVDNLVMDDATCIILVLGLVEAVAMVAPCYNRRLLYLETVLELGGFDTIIDPSLSSFFAGTVRVATQQPSLLFHCLLLVFAPSASPLLRTHVFFCFFVFSCLLLSLFFFILACRVPFRVFFLLGGTRLATFFRMAKMPPGNDRDLLKLIGIVRQKASSTHIKEVPSYVLRHHNLYVQGCVDLQRVSVMLSL